VVAFALVDVVPHIAACETHERPREFSVIGQKGLFQQYLPQAEVAASLDRLIRASNQRRWQFEAKRFNNLA
jgi:hypothetical protein